MIKMKKILAFVLALFSCTALFAQKKDYLAIFPFTGGEERDGDYIASNLIRQAVLRNCFNNTRPITRAAIATMNFEQRFQRNSGLTDADTIFELGKAVGASHVIAGYITRLGDRKLVLVSIMDVESLQQIAGYYKQYSTIEEIDRLIPEMATQLSRAVTRNTDGLPGLSVPPFVISPELNQNDAMTLAQILSCDLANAGKYAVLPRTDSLEKVLEEHKRQREGGSTDPERVKLLGKGRNAEYVLSGSVEKLGENLTQFATDILKINGDFYDTAPPEKYKDFAEGFTLIPKLAARLSRGAISGIETPLPSQEQKFSLPSSKTDPSVSFYYGVNIAHYKTIIEIGFQPGIAFDSSGDNYLSLLLDINGGLGIDSTKQTSEDGFVFGIYNIGGLIDYSFAKTISIGIGGGMGGMKDNVFPYIRGAVSVLFYDGALNVGLFYDYNFDKGYRVGIRMYGNILRIK
jgi:TolB-like protein